MRQRRTPSAGFSLLVLLAMGNWGNTPTPPSDSGAPGPVGNDGELRLDIEGRSREYLVQSARLSGDGLEVTGETVGGAPEFSLHLTLPPEARQGEGYDLESLRARELLIHGGALEVDGEKRSLTGGILTVTSLNGGGPWELDGEVQLEAGPEASYHGTIELRLRA